MIPLATLAVVFLLIAVRQIGSVRLQIWQIMLFGALLVLLTGQIRPVEALRAINVDVMLFLFGVFLIGKAMEESGYLEDLTYKLFRRTHTLTGIVLGMLLGLGFLAALLMNDTVAIVGTPMALSLARKANIKPKVLLLTLAFAVTTVSVMSPIGNPQNLLIALSGGIANPFVAFLRYLFIPTLINTGVAFAFLWLYYRQDFRNCRFTSGAALIKDRQLARLSQLSLILLVALIVFRIVVVFAGWNFDFRLTYISLVAALPVLFFAPRRPRVLTGMDWFTLIFFAAMFILMQSVWDTGIIQRFIGAADLDLAGIPTILGAAVILSQILSNVPLVALYLPVLQQLGAGMLGMVALAAGSTIAGNLTILGAASNVIIIQNAEKRDGATVSFWEFARIGMPLTLVNVAIYWVFLRYA